MVEKSMYGADIEVYNQCKWVLSIFEHIHASIFIGRGEGVHVGTIPCSVCVVVCMISSCTVLHV